MIQANLSCFRCSVVRISTVCPDNSFSMCYDTSEHYWEFELNDLAYGTQITITCNTKSETKPHPLCFFADTGSGWTLSVFISSAPTVPKVVNNRLKHMTIAHIQLAHKIQVDNNKTNFCCQTTWLNLAINSALLLWLASVELQYELHGEMWTSCNVTIWAFCHSRHQSKLWDT